MATVQFYDVVLWVHIVAVLVAFGGTFWYPVWFQLLKGWAPPERAKFHRAQLTLGRFATRWIS